MGGEQSIVSSSTLNFGGTHSGISVASERIRYRTAPSTMRVVDETFEVCGEPVQLSSEWTILIYISAGFSFVESVSQLAQRSKYTSWFDESGDHDGRSSCAWCLASEPTVHVRSSDKEDSQSPKIGASAVKSA